MTNIIRANLMGMKSPIFLIVLVLFLWAFVQGIPAAWQLPATFAGVIALGTFFTFMQIGVRRILMLDIDAASGAQIGAIFAGVLMVVFGLILGDIVVDVAAGGDTQKIDSFTGARSVRDLVPLTFQAVVVLIGVGMFTIGGAGVIGYGPMRT